MTSAASAHELLLLDLDRERDWADHDQQVADRLQDHAPAHASAQLPSSRPERRP